MPKPLEVRPRKGFRLWLRYDDGVQGEIDLSYLAGRGVFRAWAEPKRFESVRLGPQGQVTWGDDLELCADALYLKLAGKTPEQLFAALKKTKANA